VVSEEGLNAYGAVTWGQFFVYQGFNENQGWMHTSTSVDFMDDFIETVKDENGQLRYRYGEEWRPVTVQNVTLKYRNEQGHLEERTFPMYRTHHGPVTHKLAGKWVATKINWDPVEALHQSFTRTKLHGHDEFRQMMDIRRNSSNNTVYADSQGNIAYYHGDFIPKRDPRFDFSKPVDGSDPATDWKGLHEVDEIVTLLNPANGWIQNCNSTPFTAALEYSPKREDYPVYMAPDAENFRAIHAISVLTGRSGFTLDKLIETANDSYLPAFEVLIPGLVAAFDAGGKSPAELAEPIDVLRGWDYHVSADSIAMSLAHFYGTLYQEKGANPEDLRGLDLVAYQGHRSPAEERLRLFSETVKKLDEDFGTWKTPWGEINRFQRLNGDIEQRFDDGAPSLPVAMASGNWGALAAFGARSRPDTKRIYGTSGNSFVAVVEFGDKVKAKTLLAGGQSGDPGSPHFADQAQRYVDHAFKDVAYYREDVEKRAVERYHPGER
jgi:acyl-homoserine lactone acylase PvdQ